MSTLSIRMTLAASALALLAAGCSSTAEDTTADATQTAAATQAKGDAKEGDATQESKEEAKDEVAEETSQKASESDDKEAASSGVSEACKTNLPTLTKGKLVVATGDVVFEPWMVDDDPANQKGFESALVYSLGEKLGLSKDDISWTRTTFDGAIAPGKKDWDFNIQQYSITDERKAVVDFSDSYYTVQQTLVAVPDSPVAKAKALKDLTDVKLGAAIGTTSLVYIDDVIKPKEPAQVYDDNSAAKSAIDAKLVDGLVFDLPTAYYITAVEIPDASIVGTLPVQGKSEELGLLLPKGSELTSCLNEGIKALKDEGTLKKLQEEWLNRGGDIPSITE